MRALTLILLVGLFAGCHRSGPDAGSEPPVPDAGLPEGRGAVAPPVSAAPAPALHLRVYPDMAVPGKEVVVEAEVVPELPPEKMTLTFRLASDPCNGELDVEGMRAVYEVPPDCRGSKIVIEARLVTDEGERRQSVGLDIKKGSFMDSIVLKYPSPGQRVASPIPVWWDRTLYANRNERIAFTVEVHNALVLKTEEFAPDAVIELDVPPSPEKVFLTAKTSGGTVERSDLRVHERVLPGWESSAFVLDTFGSLKATSLGGKRGVIEEGGSISLALGSRVGAAQRTGFVVMEYRISKASLRLGKKPARAGIELEVPVAAPLRDFQSLVLWARGDPVRGPASPVYIQVTGSAGTTRTFEIRRLKEDWKAFSFKLHGIPGKGQSIRRVAVFVEAREVLPPNGTIMLGGLYLVPTPVTYPEPVNADQEQEGKAEAR